MRKKFLHSGCSKGGGCGSSSIPTTSASYSKAHMRMNVTARSLLGLREVEHSNTSMGKNCLSRSLSHCHSHGHNLYDERGNGATAFAFMRPSTSFDRVRVPGDSIQMRNHQQSYKSGRNEYESEMSDASVNQRVNHTTTSIDDNIDGSTQKSVAGADVFSSPLERMRQIGLGWVGVVMEYEGVIVESCFDVELAAWKTLAVELQVGSDPSAFALKRAQGMLPEHIISQVLCWTRNPTRIQEIVLRFEQLVSDAIDPKEQKLMDGARTILRSLYNTGDVAFAVVSSSRAERVRAGLFSNGIEDYFRNQQMPPGRSLSAASDKRNDCIALVAGDDILRGRPDPEAYIAASSRIQRPPDRCIVFGHTNACIEAARDAGMRCVAVASSSPIYELSSADLVVRRLDDACVLNIKKLIADVVATRGNSNDDGQEFDEYGYLQRETEEETFMSFNERKIPTMYD